MALALYRKYRPATFGDLIGQDLVVQILREAAKQDKLAHAYLFAGPRGTGKTTTARLVAKITNCEKRIADPKFKAKGEPCNACETCRGIDEGRNLDIIEIDAASNRGIDEIRNLKESVRLAPSSSRTKVFIIDEAHQLTKDAANALLKTLEEPPPYVIFILATTETEKIPATIVSRTQQFHFKHVPLKRIAEKLGTIAKAEKMRIDPETLELIAASGEGSFRDAESLLDQLISLGEEQISLETVEALVGKVGLHKIASFAGLLLAGNMEGALEALNEIQDGGYNLAQFTKDLIQHVRRTAVLKFNPAMKAFFERELSEDTVRGLTEHAKLFTDRHVELLKNLIQAYGQMRYSQFPIVPLEVAIIESLRTQGKPEARKD